MLLKRLILSKSYPKYVQLIQLFLLESYAKSMLTERLIYSLGYTKLMFLIRLIIT